MKNVKLLVLMFSIIFIFASCQTEKENSADPSESVSYTLYDYNSFNQETTHEFSYKFTTVYENTTEEFMASYTANTKQTTVNNTVSKPVNTSVSKAEVTTAQQTTAKPVVSTNGTTTAKTTNAATTAKTTKALTAVKTTKPSTTVRITAPSTTATTTKVTTTVRATTVHTHSYSSSITAAPDCTNDGIRTYKCSSCNHSYTEPIPKTDHDYNSEVVAPTKESKGYTVYTCTACGHSYEGDETLYVPTEQEAYEAITAKKTDYPDGTTWNNNNSYAWKGGIYSKGYGCAGFAFMLSDAAFGELPARKTTDVSNPRVGDILRINNDTHSVVILEVKDDCVIVAEGNFNDSVLWGREIPLSVVNAPGTYIITRYPE